ncbi:MAG: hypothetical protein LBE75_00575 [Burkholderiales bacterium]|jgi:cytochrome c553|nr:hypothetical protein [Burkholderiales bacterium]
MNTRNIFVAVMLVLVAALFIYLLGGLGTKQDVAVADSQQAAPAVTAADSSAGQPMSEADAKLEDLKQGARTAGNLSRLYLVKCSACHGRDGRGPVGPSLVGKTKEENIAVLMKYKMKQVPNSAMLGLLEKTSDQEIEMLAEEITAF